MLADDIQWNMDAMSNLRSNLIMLRDSLDTGDFATIGGSMPEFGDFDHSPMLHSHHEKAHNVMLETVKSVIECIDTFYTNLESAQSAFDDVDGISMAAFTQYRAAIDNLTEQSYLPGLDDARERGRDHAGHAAGDPGSGPGSEEA